MQIREIMTADVECCTPDTNLADVARMMVACDCGAIPVVDSPESMKPVGIITDRDIVTRIVAKGDNPMERKTGDAMSSGIACIDSESDLAECLRLMEERQIRRMPVVDKQGRLCGIVAQADIAEKTDDRATAELVKDVSQPNPPGQPGISPAAYH